MREYPVDIDPWYLGCKLPIHLRINRYLFVKRVHWEKYMVQNPEYSHSVPSGVSEKWWWSRRLKQQFICCYTPVESGYQLMEWPVVIIPDGVVVKTDGDLLTIRYEVDPVVAGLLSKDFTEYVTPFQIVAEKSSQDWMDLARWGIAMLVSLEAMQEAFTAKAGQ